MSFNIHSMYNLNLLESEEEATGDENKAQSQRQHAILSSYDDSSIAVKTVSSREDFPFPPRPPGFLLGPGFGFGEWSGCWKSLRIDLLVFTIFHCLHSKQVKIKIEAAWE